MFDGGFDIFYIFPMIVFGIIIISIVVAAIRSKKLQSKKSELVKNSEFIEKNRAKYEQIIDNNAASIADERKEYKRNGIIFGILVLSSILIYFVTMQTYFIFLIPVVIIVGGIIFGKKANAYATKSKEMYEETAKSILKELDPNLDYYPDRGYSYQEYQPLYFYEDCDRFTSEDMIVNSRTGFRTADITVESEHEDDDGHTSYVTEYDGSLAKIGIKNINCTIILGGLSKHSFRRSDTFTKIMFEHDEFNKEFLCFTDNELTAYKILTPDIMDELVTIKKSTIGDMEARLINDKLYIRFSGTNGFDGREDSKEELFASVAVLDEIMKSMNKIKEIIERKNND